LNYLKDKLKLVETTPFEDRVRFKIDPLAEYLAGMQLVEENKDEEGKWLRFLNTVSPRAVSAESIKGFLLAVLDCCMREDVRDAVPRFVIEELANMTRTGSRDPAD
jgi:hypothetical protein